MSRRFNAQINLKDFERQLIRVLLKLKPKNIVFISSAAVYGLQALENIPICENRSMNPTDEYAEEKCSLEVLLEKHTSENEISTLVLRPAGFFSCFRDEGSNSFVDRILNVSRDKSYSFVIQNGGRQVRDFCEFGFLCDVIVALFHRKEVGITCLNVKNTVGFRIGEICDKFSSSIKFDYRKDEGLELIHSELDISRLRQILGKKYSMSQYLNNLDQLTCV